MQNTPQINHAFSRVFRWGVILICIPLAAATASGPDSVAIHAELNLNGDVGQVVQFTKGNYPADQDGSWFAFLSGNESGLFSIDESTGQIVVAQPDLLRTHRPSQIELLIEQGHARAPEVLQRSIKRRFLIAAGLSEKEICRQLGGTRHYALTIKLIFPNQPPSFPPRAKPFYWPASGLVIGQVQAQDPNASDVLEYRLVSQTPKDLLTIDSQSGWLSLKQPASSPLNLSWKGVVQVQDAAGLIASTTVKVTPTVAMRLAQVLYRFQGLADTYFEQVQDQVAVRIRLIPQQLEQWQKTLNTSLGLQSTLMASTRPQIKSGGELPETVIERPSASPSPNQAKLNNLAEEAQNPPEVQDHFPVGSWGFSLATILLIYLLHRYTMPRDSSIDIVDFTECIEAPIRPDEPLETANVEPRHESVEITDGSSRQESLNNPAETFPQVEESVEITGVPNCQESPQTGTAFSTYGFEDEKSPAAEYDAPPGDSLEHNFDWESEQATTHSESFARPDAIAAYSEAEPKASSLSKSEVALIEADWQTESLAASAPTLTDPEELVLPASFLQEEHKLKTLPQTEKQAGPTPEELDKLLGMLDGKYGILREEAKAPSQSNIPAMPTQKEQIQEQPNSDEELATSIATYMSNLLKRQSPKTTLEKTPSATETLTTIEKPAPPKQTPSATPAPKVVQSPARVPGPVCTVDLEKTRSQIEQLRETSSLAAAHAIRTASGRRRRQRVRKLTIFAIGSLLVYLLIGTSSGFLNW